MCNGHEQTSSFERLACIEHAVIEHVVVEHAVIEHAVIEHAVIEHAVAKHAIIRHQSREACQRRASLLVFIDDRLIANCSTCCSSAGAACNDTDYDYPCAPDAQHQEEAIQMIENPAYAAIDDYYI